MDKDFTYQKRNKKQAMEKIRQSNYKVNIISFFKTLANKRRWSRIKGKNT